MCFLDYIIENFDRHLSNWGLSVENQTQRILGMAPIWDNGMSLDYDRPLDMRQKFDFASFNLKYDFVKDCPYTKEFQGKTNKLLVAIKSGDLFREIYDATKEFYPQKELSQKTVLFVKGRCEEFLEPLVMAVGANKIEAEGIDAENTIANAFHKAGINQQT